MIVGVCPAYLPPIKYMAWIIAQKEIAFVLSGHYQKQTYRNRTEIYGANGKLKLTIPIVHNKNNAHQLDGDVTIHYQSSWQKDHWKSFEASYRSSPFFEFYEDDLYSFFHEKEEKLMDFNIALIKKILSLLNADVKINLAKNEINESLELLNAKEKKVFKTPVYRQVFDSKYGFISNLSILDLIFNVGPESLDYLSKISL